MSEHFQGEVFPDDPGPKPEAVVTPDDGLCCWCGVPRPAGHRYLCGGCTEASIAEAITIEVVIEHERAERIRELVTP